MTREPTCQIIKLESQRGSPRSCSLLMMHDQILETRGKVRRSCCKGSRKYAMDGSPKENGPRRSQRSRASQSSRHKNLHLRSAGSLWNKAEKDPPGPGWTDIDLSVPCISITHRPISHRTFTRASQTRVETRRNHQHLYQSRRWPNSVDFQVKAGAEGGDQLWLRMK